MVEIRKGMYGLQQAGILNKNILQKHLREHGYIAVSHIPGLFRHVTRPIYFTLVVDNVGSKKVKNAIGMIFCVLSSSCMILYQIYYVPFLL